MADLAGAIAIILAAGAGKRMGAPKALMPVAGEPWWKLQHQRLQSIGVDALWVVSDAVNIEMNTDDRAPARRVVAGSDAPMMSSVLTGLRAIEADPPSGVFILPIDTPAPALKVWSRCAAAGAIAAPVYQDRNGHPVYLPWGWITEHLLGADLDPDSARLDEMITDSIVRIETDDADTATNLNRPQDLSDWLQRTRRST